MRQVSEKKSLFASRHKVKSDYLFLRKLEHHSLNCEERRNDDMKYVITADSQFRVMVPVYAYWIIRLTTLM